MIPPSDYPGLSQHLLVGAVLFCSGWFFSQTQHDFGILERGTDGAGCGAEFCGLFPLSWEFGRAIFCVVPFDGGSLRGCDRHGTDFGSLQEPRHA